MWAALSGGDSVATDFFDVASSRFIDLGPKLEHYERAGVQEYIVRARDPDEVVWHRLEGKRLTTVAPDVDGLYRSQVFPGLWLDSQALLAGDRARVREVLSRDLATREHADFVAQLARARAGP